MDEMSRNYEEEEISLVELFAVLIKNRKMIIFGTLLVSFFAALYLFVLPKAVPSLNKKEVSVTFNVQVSPLSKTLSSGLASLGTSIDLDKSISSAFRNLPVVAQKYKEHPFLGDYPKETDLYNKFISDNFSFKKNTKNAQIVDVSPSLIPAVYEIKVNILNENFDEAEQFVRDMIELVNTSENKKINEVLPALRKNAEVSIKRIEESKAQINDLNTIKTLHDLIAEIDSYNNNNNNNLYTFKDDSFVIAKARGRVKKFATVVFGSFVFFIFLAFVKWVIENTMADPEAKKIITDAWESGK